jgi:hypothetical protein
MDSADLTRLVLAKLPPPGHGQGASVEALWRAIVAGYEASGPAGVRAAVEARLDALLGPASEPAADASGRTGSREGRA